MSVRFYSVIIDAADPPKLARWWANALGWQLTLEQADEVDIAAGRGPDGKELEPILTFVPVPEAKAGKNRLHLDFAPDDQQAEVERLLSLGAAKIDVGQGDEATWVVLADPEGNEFCVLSAR
jgi:hypothetical protein